MNKRSFFIKLKFIALAILLMPTFACLASQPATITKLHETIKTPKIKSTTSIWNEKIKVKKEKSENFVEVTLFQKMLTINDSSTRLTLEEVGSAKATYNPDLQCGYVDEVYVFYNPTNRRGCGSHLFKQLVAQFYTHFICKEINFFAYAFTNPRNDRAHERLKNFYLKLGATADTKYIAKQGTNMTYPLHLAATLASLMPCLEPTLLDESLNNDPVTTIIQYVGPRAEEQVQTPVIPQTIKSKQSLSGLTIIIDDNIPTSTAYEPLANTPSNKADYASIEPL